MPAKFAIGVDLGTTNSVVGCVPLDEPEAAVSVLPVPQVAAPGTVEGRPALPSFLFLAEAPDTSGAFAVPWDEKPRDFVAGALARDQSPEQPLRTVASAKSWLCHSRVDRRAAILPWQAPDEVAKISPVEATRRYLEHLAAAWNHAHPDAPMAKQCVVLTVPASFDASARELTREAALQAGLPKDLILLEEPQAAVYAWLADQGQAWRRQLKTGDVLLVCDVGGGTTDFTLVGVASEDGELSLQRLAVGNHILVGGDNMDAALAFAAQELFAAQGVAVDAWQSVALWHACRAAKERLLGPDAPAEAPVTIQGRGRKLVGGTISAKLAKEKVNAVLLDGFFPSCAAGDRPQSKRSSGLRELGLPFEQDVAVTRHLAHFLRTNAPPGAAAPGPTHVLFNGGVFKSPVLRERVTEVLRGWGMPAAELSPQADLDCAVARGAAYYAAAKSTGGVRIRGGTARSYYVGVESAGLAVPGAPRPLRALCVVPFGMEEGTEADVPGAEFDLVTGEAATFRFFSAAARKDDRPGLVIDRWEADELVETDSLQAELPAPEGVEPGHVPVRFLSRITELGQLELWCRAVNSDAEWKLEFRVREEA